MRPLRSASIAALRFCGVTPARARISASIAVLFEREREQQPLDRHEAVAGLLGDLLGLVEHTRQAPGRDRPARRRRPRPSGRLASAASTAASASRERPPERSISPAARPFRVVEQDLQQMVRGELLVALAQSQ